MRADVYIAASSSSPKVTAKKYGYVLECKIGTEMPTRQGFRAAEGTYHNAILKAIVEAVERFRKPSEIIIHTEDQYVVNMFSNNLEMWEKSNFMTTKGKPVSNQDEWIKLRELSKIHEISMIAGKHEYSNWMHERMEKDV